jgi:hypothetical protein
MKKTVVKAALGVIWFVATYLCFAFWLAVVGAASTWGFSFEALSGGEWILVVGAHLLVVTTTVVALRYDRTWP